jgi:hypothetical protein
MPGTVEVQTDRDLPWVMNFRSFPFEGKAGNMSNVNNQAVDHKWDIWTPPPKLINGNDNISYTQEIKDVGVNPTALGMSEWIRTGGGILNTIVDMTQIGSIYGQEKMDERMATFGGASLRQHRYDWEFVPTSIAESKSIEDAAKAFQVSAYPLFAQGVGAANASIRVTHPDLWVITSAQLSGSGSGSENWRWDMTPLVSVIQSVSITSHGAAGGSYAMGNREDNHPVKWNVGVTFVELEPAVAYGDRLISRSVARSGAATKMAGPP